MRFETVITLGDYQLVWDYYGFSLDLRPFGPEPKTLLCLRRGGHQAD